MRISQREIELTQSLLTLQRQYNEVHTAKEYWMRLSRERLVEIERLHKEIKSLIQEIDRNAADGFPVSIPPTVVFNCTDSALIRDEVKDAPGA